MGEEVWLSARMEEVVGEERKKPQGENGNTLNFKWGGNGQCFKLKGKYLLNDDFTTNPNKEF